MPARIRLEPNIPVTVALVDPFADSSAGYDAEMHVCEYRTCDGQILALPRAAAIDLNNLDPKPGESITVTRAKVGHHITVCLTVEAEKIRAQEEADEPTDTEYLLAASLTRQEARKRRNGHPTPIRKEPAPATEPVQPRLFDRGTGTDGPAPQLAPAAIATPKPALGRQRVKYGDALRHIVHTVEEILKAENVQLGDEPRQGLYSTVYIDFARRSGVEYDFTTEGR